MPEPDDLLIGQIALEKKLITPEQLREALKEHLPAGGSAKAGPRLLGVALVAKGFLTDAQLVALIDEQRRRMNETPNYADVRKGDILFGKLVVKDGRATEEQVNAALRPQQELAEEGTIRRLGEILDLPADAVQATLKQQGKTLMSCPTCGARFNVVGYLGGKAYQCQKCGMKLDVATQGVGADETAFDIPVVKEDLSKSVDESMDDPKKRFGKYVLVKQVGAGGFGAVYKAYEKGLGRTVALKFLHSENPEDIQRLVREAQTAAKLTHPYIVPLFEVGECDGKHYLAMEFVEGQTLDKLRMEPERAAEIMRDVAEALEYAHEKGIIHRDLKPSNILVTLHDGVPVPKVIDFGIAKATEGRLTDATVYTQLHQFIGTPAYMSPEQAEMSGLDIDTRADIYSLGVLLYELLVGQTPFDAKEM
ncbi:MAG: protein kinase, partial [Pedosphaera parvula]|nr:protein kinase [Pedosphaera parvula]